MRKLKLNRKGFTLIELLAIIVILAIIMVVTIPTVLNSMDTARKSQLENAAESVAEWLQKQYELSYMGTLGGDVNSTYSNFVSGKTINDSGAPLSMTTELLEAAGIADATSNITSGTFYYNADKGRMCVSLTGTENGSFGNNTATSAGCATAPAGS